MKTYKRLITGLIFLSLVMISTTALADDNIVNVTSSQQTQSDIEITSSQLELSLKASDLDDIYAFTLDFNYDPNKMKILSIKAGDIFSDYGSAVLINDIDNETGKASFMQTLLSVDEGVSENKTLCTISISLESGEYNFTEDFGAEIKIANSDPAYIDTYISDVKIIANEIEESTTAETSEPTATPSPQLGVVTPKPESKQSSSFEVAEDEPIEEIIAEIEESEKKVASAEQVVEEDAEEKDTTIETGANKIITEANMEENQDKKIDTKLLILIIVLAVFIPTIIISLILYFKRKPVNGDLILHENGVLKMQFYGAVISCSQIVC